MRRLAAAPTDQRIRLQIADDPDMREPLIDVPCEQAHALVIPEDQTRLLKPQVAYFWRLVAENQWGATVSPSAARQLTIDPTLNAT